MSEIKNYIHPEVRAHLAEMKPRKTLEENIASNREDVNRMVVEMFSALPQDPEIETIQLEIPGIEKGRMIAASMYIPVKAKEKAKNSDTKLPCILSIHGGGLYCGTVLGEEPFNKTMAKQTDCIVISPEYRLAPEDPYPAGLYDCYATLLWIAEHADECNIDIEKIAVYGGSAGACMAASTATYTANVNGPKVALQILVAPMLDCRSITSSSYEVTDERLWNRDINTLAWKLYLRDVDLENIPGTACPALLDDFSILPPTFITVGTADLFRDEAIEYAQNIAKAGGQVELHVTPGMYHGAEGGVPGADISKKNIELRYKAMRQFFEKGYL